jgi:hypothetical protein
MVISVEAITEIITSSTLTEPARMWYKSKLYRTDAPPRTGVLQYFFVFLDKLISCGYCTSVWISGLVSFLVFPQIIEDPVWNFALLTFSVHRMSNLLHVCYELIRKGRVKTHDFLMKFTDDN